MDKPSDRLESDRGRILAMDDLASIRRMLQVMLPAIGYDVTCVSNGMEAIAQYREAMLEGKPYAAVILDLILPGDMGGREVLAQLQALDPAVKALASSGYIDALVIADVLQAGFQGVVPKPYTMEQLSSELQRILSPPATPPPC